MPFADDIFALLAGGDDTCVESVCANAALLVSAASASTAARSERTDLMVTPVEDGARARGGDLVVARLMNGERD
jgi:hypothetical protein